MADASVRPVVAVLGRGVVAADEPVACADDLGLVRGDGCFDSMRVLSDGVTGRPDNMAAHLVRLADSAATLGIPMPAESDWTGLVEQALAAWVAAGGVGEGTLRFVLTRGREWHPDTGPLAYVTIVSHAPDTTSARGGLRAVTLSAGHPSDAYADAPWLLGGVKTLSYVVKVAALREARARGAQDAIFTTTDGYALDGTTSGLVVLRDGRLLTTPLEGTGLLESTTVSRCVAAARAAGRDAEYELIPVAALYDADGVWLISSSRGPAPVVELDARPLAVDPALTALVATWAGFGETEPGAR